MGDFSWVDNFGLEDVVPVETPLPGAAKEAAAETPKQAEPTGDPAKPAEPAKATVEGEKKEAAPDKPAEKPAEAAAPEAVAKPEAKAEIKDDPELTPEDNELIRTRPAAEQPELTDRLKKASFISQYKDPEVPAEGTVEALRKISPSSFARLESTIIDKRLAEPVPFLDELFERSPETYGKLMLEGFRADPGYFIKQITGKDGLTAEAIKTAVEFYDTNKDRVVEEPAGKGLSDDELADAKLYLGDEVAARIDAALKRASAPAAKPAAAEPPKKATEEKPAEKPEAKTEAKPKEEAKPEPQEAPKAAQDEIWDAASGQIESYLDTWADDPKDGLGLKVTPQERELAPEVADLKDFKRTVLFDGLGDLPDFRRGLTEWGKERPEFMAKLKQAIHFVKVGEKDNAMEAGRGLLPFVEKYKQERMNAPIFARIDAQIAAAAARTNPKTESDTIIPGAVGASSPKAPSDPNKRIDDLLLSDAQNA